MTDPLALDPVLPKRQRSERPWNDDLPHDERYAHFEAHVTEGGKIEATDWMPDEYRTAVLRFVEMHANSELMGVLPEREWLMRAPTLRRKLALTAKVQDEVGHAQLLYRVAEDLGKPREAMLDDLIAGKTKFHNVFHYPTRSWGDIGIIAWLVDAAAIVAQQALRDSSYAPVRAHDAEDLLGGVGPHHARPRRGGDADDRLRLRSGRSSRRRSTAGGARSCRCTARAATAAKDRDLHWRIKAKTTEELRQEFLTIYVPRILELGLTIPDPELRYDDDGEGLALHRARLGRAADGRHGPRPEVPGAPRVPPPEPRGDALGARHRASRRAWPRHERGRGPHHRCGGARRPRTLRGVPPGEGRRPDAPRRQRARARTPSWRCTTPASCSGGGTRAPACGSCAGPTSRSWRIPTSSIHRSIGRSRSPGGT